MDQPSEKLQRLKLLKVLCILTFIGSGISFFSYFVLVFTLGFFRTMETPEMFGLFQSEDEQDMLFMIFSLPKVYFIIHSILYAASLYGAYLMWHLRKVGFHFYAIAQISLLIVYKAFIPEVPFPFIPLMITAVFILLYYSHLQFMR